MTKFFRWKMKRHQGTILDDFVLYDDPRKLSGAAT